MNNVAYSDSAKIFFGEPVTAAPVRTADRKLVSQPLSFDPANSSANVRPSSSGPTGLTR